MQCAADADHANTELCQPVVACPPNELLYQLYLYPDQSRNPPRHPVLSPVNQNRVRLPRSPPRRRRHAVAHIVDTPATDSPSLSFSTTVETLLSASKGLAWASQLDLPIPSSSVFVTRSRCHLGTNLYGSLSGREPYGSYPPLVTFDFVLACSRVQSVPNPDDIAVDTHGTVHKKPEAPQPPTLHYTFSCIDRRRGLTS